MTPLTFKDADGILLVCDLTDKSSLMGLKDWVKTIKDHAAEDIGKLLLRQLFAWQAISSIWKT